MEFAAFSLKAVKAAEQQLAAFLKLMPYDALEAARTQLDYSIAAASPAQEE